MSRIHTVLDIAARMVAALPPGNTRRGLESRLDGLTWYEGYATSAKPHPVGIVAGNWNDVGETKIMSRVGDVLERLGCAAVWSDEYTACDSCSYAICTEPDCFDWRPQYVLRDAMREYGYHGRGEILCEKCARDECPLVYARRDVDDAYTVDEHGTIRSPGKFEGEPMYVCYLWGVGLDGCADYDEVDAYGFDVDDALRHAFPEIPDDTEVVWLRESDYGFVYECDAPCDDDESPDDESDEDLETPEGGL